MKKHKAQYLLTIQMEYYVFMKYIAKFCVAISLTLHSTIRQCQTIITKNKEYKP